MDLYPWRLDSIHSHCHDDVISILNNFPVMAVILRPTFGGIFFRGHISPKNRTYCPLLATIQRLSKVRLLKARVFLLRVKISEG
jgi:hypothetical protein